MSNGWTPERRAKQSKAIHQWRPWERSTGPTSVEGKRRSAMRGYKGGTWRALRRLARLLREQQGRMEVGRMHAKLVPTARRTRR